MSKPDRPPVPAGRVPSRTFDPQRTAAPGEETTAPGRLPDELTQRLTEIEPMDYPSAGYLYRAVLDGARRVVVKTSYLQHEPDARMMAERAWKAADPAYVVPLRWTGTQAEQRRHLTVTDYLPAGSLHDYARRLDGKFPLDRLAEVVRQVAGILRHIHEEVPGRLGRPDARWVHGDLKPANLLVDREEPVRLKLTDLDHSMWDDAEERAWTPVYRAPERYLGVVLPAADWWALGITVLELAQGRHPLCDPVTGMFPPERDLGRLISKQLPVDPSLPPSWQLLIRGLLDPSYETRWGYAQVTGWLRANASPASPPARTREVKVLVVGEGTVGKTSLIAALRGDPFEDRSRTHGVEINPLSFVDPLSGDDMTLRMWDFGGQPVYRSTHQVFFSPDALYLVVWNARSGQRKDDVDGWLHEIRARVGPQASVLLVATHCADNAPRLDYDRLRQDHAGLLRGHFDVDNRTGLGIERLRVAIAEESVALSQPDSLGAEARAVRRELTDLARQQPQLSFPEFTAIANRHGLDEAGAERLASRLHRIGEIIYYGQDPDLRDLIVLDPEWLAKAIALVLDDPETAGRGGVLDHSRLASLWRPDRDPRYLRRHHPYFLRLMERFGISFRLTAPNRSLVALLTPAQRPALPWDRNTAVAPGLRRLSLVCEFSGPIAGFVAALTVRLNHYDTGLRWRSGVFLRHPHDGYASEALIECHEDRQIYVEVRAPSPDLLFHVLVDTVEHLMATRWRGLTYSEFVPCPAGCGGRFGLAPLFRRQSSGVPGVTCAYCDTEYDVDNLLSGGAVPRAPGLPVATALDGLRHQMGLIDQRVSALQAAAADNAHVMRRLLGFVSTEITDCPRLFTVTAARRRGLQRLKVHQDRLTLTLWCERPEHWHPMSEASYDLDVSKEWVQRVGRYAGPVFAVLRRVMPVAGAVTGLGLDFGHLANAQNELDLMSELVEAVPEFRVDDGAWTDAAFTRPAAVDEAGLRAVREILQQLDPRRRYGGLRRVQDASGQILWVCPEHRAYYDPDLPRLSSS